MGRNLISVGDLTDKEYRITFHSGGGEIEHNGSVISRIINKGKLFVLGEQPEVNLMDEGESNMDEPISINMSSVDEEMRNKHESISTDKWTNQCPKWTKKYPK